MTAHRSFSSTGLFLAVLATGLLVVVTLLAVIVVPPNRLRTSLPANTVLSQTVPGLEILDFYVTPEIGARVFVPPDLPPKCTKKKCSPTFTGAIGEMPAKKPFTVQEAHMVPPLDGSLDEGLVTEPEWSPGEVRLVFQSPAAALWTLHTDYPLFFQCGTMNPVLGMATGTVPDAGQHTVSCTVYTNLVSPAAVDVTYDIVAEVSAEAPVPSESPSTLPSEEPTPAVTTEPSPQPSPLISVEPSPREKPTTEPSQEPSPALSPVPIVKLLHHTNTPVGRVAGTVAATQQQTARWSERTDDWDERPQPGDYKLIEQPDGKVLRDAPTPGGAFVNASFSNEACGQGRILGCAELHEPTKKLLRYTATAWTERKDDGSLVCYPTKSKTTFKKAPPNAKEQTILLNAIDIVGKPTVHFPITLHYAVFKDYPEFPLQSGTLKEFSKTIREHEEGHQEYYREYVERLISLHFVEVAPSEVWHNVLKKAPFNYDGRQFTYPANGVPGMGLPPVSELADPACPSLLLRMAHNTYDNLMGSWDDAYVNNDPESNRLKQRPPQSVRGYVWWNQMKFDSYTGRLCFWRQENPGPGTASCFQQKVVPEWLFKGKGGVFNKHWPQIDVRRGSLLDVGDEVKRDNGRLQYKRDE